MEYFQYHLYSSLLLADCQYNTLCSASGLNVECSSISVVVLKNVTVGPQTVSWGSGSWRLFHLVWPQL